MLAPTNKDLSIYSNQVRVRVCGLLREGNKLLLLKHKSLGSKNVLWLPPGGGIEFGESAREALEREFLEETNLQIEVTSFLFTYEMINQKHHAIELFYEVRRVSGDLKLGTDPELNADSQIIEELALLTFDQIDDMDKETLHGIFSEVKSSESVHRLRGLFSFKH